MRALGSLGNYRGEAPVLVWLLSIARRVCADHVRRRQRQRRLIERITQYTVARDTAAPEIASGFLDVLDPDRREAFVLTQLVGLSYDEAAQVVGCPVGTIRSRVSRARSDLLDAVRRSTAV
jgi:RNA polymerase sigma-70 factor (ECF subfamily)